jgi:hypothetical protein
MNYEQSGSLTKMGIPRQICLDTVIILFLALGGKLYKVGIFLHVSFYASEMAQRTV